MAPSLTASGLKKRYGDVMALDGFDLTVPTGTVHGLLGPNGAGKSTAVKSLATLVDLDAGTASVAGLDVRTSAHRVRERIGLVGQSAAVDEILGGLLIGWRTTSGPAAVALAVLLLLLLRFAMLWVGIYLGLALGSGATTAVRVLVWPIGFLSTAIVSTETMPGWLGAVANGNPLSATATAARSLFGNQTGITSGPLADWSVALAVA